MDNIELKTLFHCVAEHADPVVPWDWCEGTCFNLQVLEEHGYITLDQQMKAESLMDAWAGNAHAYPVPASPDAMHGRDGTSGDANADCFDLHVSLHLDMYTGTYGRSHREMCLYIARNL